MGVESLKCVLATYEHISGQKVSLAKSSLFFKTCLNCFTWAIC